MVESPDGASLEVRTMPVVFRRIYTGADGHSYFELIQLSGEEVSSPNSQLSAILGKAIGVQSATFRYVLRETDPLVRHNAPCRQFVVLLSGRCEVETSLGDVWAMRPGDVLLAEDMTGLGHITRRIGSADRLTMFITIGETSP